MDLRHRPAMVGDRPARAGPASRACRTASPGRIGSASLRAGPDLGGRDCSTSGARRDRATRRARTAALRTTGASIGRPPLRRPVPRLRHPNRRLEARRFVCERVHRPHGPRRREARGKLPTYRWPETRCRSRCGYAAGARPWPAVRSSPSATNAAYRWRARPSSALNCPSSQAVVRNAGARSSPAVAR